LGLGLEGSVAGNLMAQHSSRICSLRIVNRLPGALGRRLTGTGHYCYLTAGVVKFNNGINACEARSGIVGTPAHPAEREATVWSGWLRTASRRSSDGSPKVVPRGQWRSNVDTHIAESLAGIGASV
jgi:hypothetical protein